MEMMSKSKVFNNEDEEDEQEEEERPYGEDSSQFVEDHFKSEDEVREEIKERLRGTKGEKSYYRCVNCKRMAFMESTKIQESDDYIWFKGDHNARVMWNHTAPDDADTQLYAE